MTTVFAPADPNLGAAVAATDGKHKSFNHQRICVGKGKRDGRGATQYSNEEN